MRKVRFPPWKPSGGSYTAPAVHFDGSTWLAIATLLAADSPLITASGWAKATFTGAAHAWLFYDIDPVGMEVGPYLGSSPDPALVGSAYGSGGGKFLTSRSGANAWTDDVWHHVFAYADTNHAAGSKTIKVFLDSVDITGTVSDSDSAFSIPFSTVGFALPDTTDDFPTPELTGDYADWWVAPGVLETDITKFRDPITGKPVYLGANGEVPTGTAPAVFFSGNAAAFPTNLGTGGAFTLTGSLTNASTSPSD